jgi:hypothetical protein
MAGTDVFRAAVGDRCPACGALLDIDGWHRRCDGEVIWFASLPATRCT